MKKIIMGICIFILGLGYVNANVDYKEKSKEYDFLKSLIFNGYMSYNEFEKFILSKDINPVMASRIYLSGIVNALYFENLSREKEGLPKIYCSKKGLQAEVVGKLVIEYAHSFNGEPIKRFGDDDLYHLVWLTLRYYYPCPVDNK